MINPDALDAMRYAQYYFDILRPKQKPTLTVDTVVPKRYQPEPTDIIENAQFEEVL